MEPKIRSYFKVPNNQAQHFPLNGGLELSDMFFMSDSSKASIRGLIFGLPNSTLSRDHEILGRASDNQPKPPFVHGTKGMAQWSVCSRGVVCGVLRVPRNKSASNISLLSGHIQIGISFEIFAFFVYKKFSHSSLNNSNTSLKSVSKIITRQARPTSYRKIKEVYAKLQLP